MADALDWLVGDRQQSINDVKRLGSQHAAIENIIHSNNEVWSLSFKDMKKRLNELYFDWLTTECLEGGMADLASRVANFDDADTLVQCWQNQELENSAEEDAFLFERLPRMETEE